MRAGKALRALARHGPGVFERAAAAGEYALAPARCILTTALGIDALREVGVVAVPLSVKTQLVNAAWVQWHRDGQPGGGEELARRGGFLLETDERPFGQATDPVTNAWRGHLVIVAGDSILDLDLRQMRRPSRGLGAIPDAAVFHWPPGTTQAHYDLPGGALLRITACLEDRSFETANDWSLRKPFTRELVAGLVRAIRKGS